MTQRQNIAAETLIRRCLFWQGVSQADIARRLGVSRGLVCHVIAGRRKHGAVREALAELVRVPVSALWED